MESGDTDTERGMKCKSSFWIQDYKVEKYSRNQFMILKVLMPIEHHFGVLKLEFKRNVKKFVCTPSIHDGNWTSLPLV